MIEGFCIPCRDNVPVDSSRSCIRDGHITIPPTYGKRTQEWVDGAWVPFIPRPEGYVWSAPTEPAPTEPAPKPQASRPTPRPPAPKRAWSPPKRKSRAAEQPVMVTVTCGVCRVTVTKRRWGGHQQRFCSTPCRNKARGPRPAGNRTTPMSAMGRRCVECGRDDVPHRAKGMCPVCAQRIRRRAMREAAV